MVRLAESETERIFARAGAHLEWHECGVTALAESADPTCAAPLTPSDLILRIVKRVNLVRIHASAENIGFTMGNMSTVQMEPLARNPREPGYALAIRCSAGPWHTNLDTLSSARGTFLKASCEPAGAKNSWSSQASMIWSLPLTRKRRCAWRSRRAMPEAKGFPSRRPGSLRLPTIDEKAPAWLARSAVAARLGHCPGVCRPRNWVRLQSVSALLTSREGFSNRRSYCHTGHFTAYTRKCPMPALDCESRSCWRVISVLYSPGLSKSAGSRLSCSNCVSSRAHRTACQSDRDS